MRLAAREAGDAGEGVKAGATKPRSQGWLPLGRDPAYASETKPRMQGWFPLGRDPAYASETKPRMQGWFPLGRDPAYGDTNTGLIEAGRG